MSMFLDEIASQELSLGIILLPLSCQAQVLGWGSGLGKVVLIFTIYSIAVFSSCVFSFCKSILWSLPLSCIYRSSVYLHWVYGSICLVDRTFCIYN